MRLRNNESNERERYQLGRLISKKKREMKDTEREERGGETGR